MTFEIIVFVTVILGLLLADFLLVGKNSHSISTKEAGIWTGVFVMASLLFAGFIYIDQGSVKATEFLTAYTIEKVLSVDNLFVFVTIFAFFKVPTQYHHKVLFWGVMGAIVMRAIFIFLGVAFIQLLEFKIWGYDINILIIVFGLLLTVIGVKSAIKLLNDDDSDDEEDYSNSPGAKLIKYFFKGHVSDQYDGDKFFTYRQEIHPAGDIILDNPIQYTSSVTKLVKYATPLLVVVGVTEFTDVIFATDSIPAIFAVSKDPFILYSSNIFAILGLRSMYFLLANMMPLFIYLNHGLAFILTFIGVKMLIAPFYHIDSNVSLLIVLFVLIASVTISLMNKKPITS